jgi:hypothetical protein
MLLQFVNAEIAFIRCMIMARDRLLFGRESKHHFCCFTFLALFCCVINYSCVSKEFIE